MKKLFLFMVLVGIAFVTDANNRHKQSSMFMSYKGLVMAGYQGWFNTPNDGAGRGWNHYKKDNDFYPGKCTIDMWPDVSEYKDLYKTSFLHNDGKNAYVFSSYDKSTVDLHFSWMKKYGIDGVFMQRFVQTIKNDKGLRHSNVVLNNAIKASENNNRAICIMYDLSGMDENDYSKVIEDWKFLVDSLSITMRDTNTYLYHNNKPLVAIWGVGFKNRKYGYDEVEKLVDFFKNDKDYGGCSIMLGVPTYWRELGRDTDNNIRLHNVIKKTDIVMPWLVGRFNNDSYQQYFPNISKDIKWCNSNKLDYVPVIFPGFSWYNMHTNTKSNAIPRLKGKFFWKQIYSSVLSGAEMIYYAMFDEIDEGTAIFKITNDVPVGESIFVGTEGLPSDFYLWLSGMGRKLLNGEIKSDGTIPIRK